MVGFPEPREGVLYLTEGGQETELMYKHGHDLPEFALYPLLDEAAAVDDLTSMYTRYLEVAARHGFVALMGGLDYRASPDWSGKLGISAEGLVEYQLRSIDFLRGVAKPFSETRVMIAGAGGPRGDAYGEDRTITAAEAEDYHAVQLTTLKSADVDLATAMTFNNVPEAVGVARAAAAVSLPLSMSFMVNSSGQLTTGPSLREAIESVDEQTGEARPDFYGINCSHPTEFAPALEPGEWRERLSSLRPNASMAEKQSLCTIGHLEAGDPEQLGEQLAGLAKDLPSVDIWGGCCGTWDDHLDAMARRLAPVRGVGSG